MLTDLAQRHRLTTRRPERLTHRRPRFTVGALSLFHHRLMVGEVIADGTLFIKCPLQVQQCRQLFGEGR